MRSNTWCGFLLVLWTKTQCTQKPIDWHTYLSAKFLLAAGWNISSTKLLCDLFFDEDCKISSTIFLSQPQVEHMLSEKTIMQNNFFLHETNFSFKCPNICTSKLNLFLDLKWNKRLLDNKYWKLLDTTVSCMNQRLWGYIFLYSCETWFLKN